MINKSPIRSNPITGGIGAEIDGIDLRQPIPDEVAGALRDALDRYLLVVFRDQFLDTHHHYRLTEVFGTPCVNPYAPGPAEHPEMTYVIKEADERTGVFGGGWHTDLSFIEEPPTGSVLCAIEVPPYGGDTLWANQRAAWRALPEPLKQLLDGRDAIHVGKPYGVKWAPPVEEQAMKGSTRRGDPQADKERFHPAVLTHPRTGERSLYVNPTYTMRLDGLTEDESRPILARLFDAGQAAVDRRARDPGQRLDPAARGVGVEIEDRAVAPHRQRGEDFRRLGLGPAGDEDVFDAQPQFGRLRDRRRLQPVSRVGDQPGAPHPDRAEDRRPAGGQDERRLYGVAQTPRRQRSAPRLRGPGTESHQPSHCAFSTIQAQISGNGMPTWRACSGTSDKAVMPGWVLISKQ